MQKSTKGKKNLEFYHLQITTLNILMHFLYKCMFLYTYLF
jgi:hypothetical protein